MGKINYNNFRYWNDYYINIEGKERKYFKLINDNLIIHQIFSNQKVYNLKSVSSWTENHYIFLGI